MNVITFSISAKSYTGSSSKSSYAIVNRLAPEISGASSFVPLKEISEKVKASVLAI